MKKLILVVLLASVLLILSADFAHAQNPESEASASIKTNIQSADFDYRVSNLRNFLAYFDSPLSEYADSLVYFADFYGLDYRLVASISGVESTFGKRIPYKSYNAYGWANGNYSFSSWQDSISIVSSTLRREYIDKGAASIAKIARRYAPPSSTWGGKVQYFIRKIDVLPLDFDII